jgi:hypothetical protein
VKIRGTAVHIAEKYTSLARDAMASGDSVAAENYLQHAEHYNRIIMAAQAQNASIPGIEQPAMNGSGRFNPAEPFHRDHEDGQDEEGEDGFLPQQRVFEERPAYNQNQPQPFIPQNAFPQVQPPVPAQNGMAPYPSDNFVPSPEGSGPRRRRRRPMGEHGKSFNGRHDGGGAPPANGAAAGSDTPPDETAS